MFSSKCNLVVFCSAVLALGGCASHPPRAGTTPGPSHEPQPKTYLCRYTREPITINGRLDDPAWSTASWTDPFVDIEGDTKPRPRYETRARLLWDDEFLYIGAQLEEPHVWATFTQHDQIVFHDNDFEVFIDPNGDTREYYEIEVNALNTIFDLFLERTYFDGGPARHEWDLAGLKSAVRVNGTLNDPSDVDRAWTVEFGLPWQSLAQYAHMPTPPHPGDTWRINFSRVEWKHRIVDGRYERVPKTPEDNWVWSPQGEINMHLPQRWGYVTFTKNDR
jgi:hypothetical protein